MDVTALGAWVAAISAWRSRHVSHPGRERRKDRVEAVDDILLAADHHAVAAFQTPDAAARSNIDIMQTALLERCRAANVVLPERIAAVDDDVSTVQQLAQPADRVVCDSAGGQHHPNRPRLCKPAHKLLDPARSRSSFTGHAHDGRLISVVHHRLVPVPDESTNDVAPHASESDDSDLHRMSSSWRQRRLDYSLEAPLRRADDALIKSRPFRWFPERADPTAKPTGIWLVTCEGRLGRRQNPGTPVAAQGFEPYACRSTTRGLGV